MKHLKLYPSLRRLLRHPRRKRSRRKRRLRFSPHAWAKLLYLRDAGPTEVGGFGIGSAEDPLCIQDVVLLPQTCSVLSVLFEETAIADYFEEQVDRGLRPEQFARVWLHTHPGDCAEPSAVDVRTFARVFGHCDWAVMGIIARGGAVHAEFARPGSEPQRLPVELDWRQTFPASNHPAWQAEYDRCVTPEPTPAFDWLNQAHFHWPMP